jgi:hypothetical protein
MTPVARILCAALRRSSEHLPPSCRYLTTTILALRTHRQPQPLPQGHLVLHEEEAQDTARKRMQQISLMPPNLGPAVQTPSPLHIPPHEEEEGSGRAECATCSVHTRDLYTVPLLSVEDVGALPPTGLPKFKGSASQAEPEFTFLPPGHSSAISKQRRPLSSPFFHFRLCENEQRTRCWVLTTDYPRKASASTLDTSST